MVATLIKGGCVLTLGARTSNYRVADVLIEDGAIAEIGQGIRARGADLIDATDTIVMPGFVDAHRHAWRGLFPNTATRLSDTVAEHVAPDDLYAATLSSLLSAAAAGITTVADWCDVPSSDAHTEASLQAHTDSGLRTLLVSNAADSNSIGPHTVLAYAAKTPSTPDDAESEIRRGRAAGRPVHMHVGTPKSPPGLVAELGNRDVLTDDITLIHGTNLNESDFDAIAASGCGLVLCPTTEMADGYGMPPLQGIIDRSIRPGLGVKDAGFGSADLFAQMRAANSVQHAVLFDLKLAGKGGIPNLLSTRDVIRYATIDGAHAIRGDRASGSLELGKQADLIILRADRPNIAPVNDPIGAVVWGMDTSNVDWVFVAGHPVVQSGEVQGAERATELAATAARRVGEASGILAAPVGKS